MAVFILPYLETCTYCLRSHIWGRSFSYVDPLYQKFISCSYCAQFKCQFSDLCYALKIQKNCMYVCINLKENTKYMFFKIIYKPFWYTTDNYIFYLSNFVIYVVLWKIQKTHTYWGDIISQIVLSDRGHRAKCFAITSLS